jgi:hypothetical protein
LLVYMSNPAEAARSRLSTPPSYSAAARKALALSAVVITLLPIPVTYFGILPAYQVHAHFLLFYAPFLCLLTLTYLFYVRDSLARAMFANLLDRSPPPDPYYQEPMSERLGRWFRRLKGIILGILPALLVITSMYCVSRYVVAFNESVARATEAYVERVGSGEEVGMVREEGKQRRAPIPSSQRNRLPVSRDTVAADTLPQPSDSTAVRGYVLRTSGIESIPGVIGLTGLYIGSFVALLVAVTLMALKEYAKEAMGLSEQEMMFGRYKQGDEQ